MKSSGPVVCSYFTCMFGQRETCSYVGAVLYVLKTPVGSNMHIKIQLIDDVNSCKNMLDDIDPTNVEKKMK